MMTKKECLELAKKCGAVADTTIVTFWPNEFFAYTSAIEEKYQAEISDLRSELGGLHATFDGYAHQHNAQIAMLRDALSNHRWHDANCVSITESGCPPCDCGFEKILDDTQQSSDAFIAEVKAMALEEAAIWFDAEEYVTYTIKNGVISHEDYAEFQLRRMAAELRNQQEGKEGK